jgi:hypothetical protein
MNLMLLAALTTGKILFSVLFLMGVVVIAGSRAVVQTGCPRIRRLDDAVAAELRDEVAGIIPHPWPVEHGFHFHGAFACTLAAPADIIVWRHQNESTFLCVYLSVGRPSVDLHTVCAPALGVTTGNSPAGHMLPHPPAALVQTFPGARIGELWNAHQAAQQFIQRSFDASPSPGPLDFETVFLEAVVGRIRYVRSLLFWPLRLPYWNLLRRRMMTGVSIESQFGRGWLPAPAAAPRLPRSLPSPKLD